MVVKHGLTLRGEHRLRVFENRILRRPNKGVKRMIKGSEEGFTVRDFMVCNVRLI